MNKVSFARKFFSTMLVFAIFIPNLIFAATNTVKDIDSLLKKVLSILNFLIPVLIAIAIVFFIWSIISYVFKKGEEDKKIARQNMIWGIISLFVIVSVWGLVNVLLNTFGFDAQNMETPTLPSIELPISKPVTL